MLFNSTLYLLFLPLVALLFYRLQLRGRQYLLLAASMVFYATWSVPFTFLMLGCLVVSWATAVALADLKHPHARRAVLALSVIACLSVLGLFKYANFLTLSIRELTGFQPWPMLDLILPLGISFYTFQAMSYTIDVYRGLYPPKRSVLDVVLYVSFFPQLVAGPIVRAQDLMPQLSSYRPLDWAMIREGVGRIIWGLIKKVYVADLAANIVNEAYGNVDRSSGLGLIMATYAFAVQIYCDFSAYSDIAIGSGLVLGIRLPENFRSPYLSCGLREFWRRWHISFSTWLRDYLYIPLGGSRVSAVRTYINLMITMLLGGLWHGAGWNWVAWGGLQGGIMSVERMLGISEKPPQRLLPRLLRWFITFHLVCLSWVLFRSHSLSEAGTVFRRVFTFAPGEYHGGLAPLVCLGLVLSAEVMGVREAWTRWISKQTLMARWLAYAAACVFILTFQGTRNPEFIYFQF